MNLLHPKALKVSNLMEGFFLQMREQNGKAVNHVAGDRSPDLKRPAKTESFERNTLQEGEAVSPAAPLKPSDPARGIVIGIIFGGIFWGGLFLVRWFIRLCS